MRAYYCVYLDVQKCDYRPSPNPLLGTPKRPETTGCDSAIKYAVSHSRFGGAASKANHNSLLLQTDRYLLTVTWGTTSGSGAADASR